MKQVYFSLDFKLIVIDADLKEHDLVTTCHLHTCRLVDGTLMNEGCVAVDAVGSMPKLQPRVDRQVCAVSFLT